MITMMYLLFKQDKATPNATLGLFLIDVIVEIVSVVSLAFILLSKIN